MHRPFAHHARVTRVAGCVAALSVVVLALAGTAGAASAHGVEGEMTMTKLEQTGPTTVHVEVGIVYDGDQDPAEDATVEATLTDVDGTAVGPTDLPRVDAQSSLYAADIEVTGPGTWAVEVSSTEPSGTASAVIEVVTQDATAPGTETTAVSDPTETSTTAVEDDPDDQITTADGADEADTEDTDTDTDETSNGATLIVLAVAAVVLVVGAGVVVWMRRRGGSDLADSSDDGPDTNEDGPSTP